MNNNSAFMSFLKIKMMKIFNFLYLMVFLFAAIMNSELSYAQNQTNELSLSAEEQSWISEHPSIRVTSQMDWPPFDFVQGGVISGFSIDYLNLISSKTGINFEYVNGYTWEQLNDQLINKEIDLTHSIMQTDERDEFLNFTTPYIDLPFVYYGRTGTAPITSPEDLNGKRVGYIKGFAHEAIYKRNYPSLILVEQKSVPEALVAISTGEIDIFSSTLPIANYIISKNFITGVEIVGRDALPEIDGILSLRLASRNDWPILRDILEKAKSAITEKEFRDLSNKWLSQYSVENEIDLTDEELNWLLENNTIRVATDPTFAPLEFISKDNELSGISGAFLKKIAEKINVEFIWAGSNNWTEALEKMQSGEADMLSAVVPTIETGKYLTFTDSYMNFTNVILTLEGGEIFSNLTSLSGRKISQLKGFSLAEFIRQDYPGIEIIEVDTVAEALQQVITGKVDAYVGDVTTTSYVMAQEALSGLVATGDTEYRTNPAMGVRSDLPILASIIQKAVQSITEIERAEITREWLSLRIENTRNYDLIWKIVAIFFAVLFIILIWAFSLRREVKRREILEEKLVKSQAEAEAANIAKSNFLANMSHEVRTPLNAIIGFSDVMSSGLYGKIEQAKYREYLQDIKGSGEHLATVINDILDLSKIEAGKWILSEKDFNLDNCITETFRMFENEISEKNLSLNLKNNDEQLKISGDESCIKRIIINLISNSVKNTKNGGRIDCLVSTNENNDISISIKDTGIGIPEDKLDMVLNPFEQIEDDFLVTEPGTGLGLPIVKNLVELHDGSFSLISEMGVGTEAIIIFPAARIVT